MSVEKMPLLERNLPMTPTTLMQAATDIVEMVRDDIDDDDEPDLAPQIVRQELGRMLRRGL